MTRVPRFASLLIALTLLVAGLVLAPTSPVAAQQLIVEEISLQVSENLDRSDAVPLDGATVAPDQDLAVSVALGDVGIDLVAFFVDDALVNVDLAAPFDLTGTADGGDALPTQFATGDHSVTAFAISAGQIGVATADFTAGEVVPPSILEIATEAGLTSLIDAVVAASGGEIDFAAAVADCDAEVPVDLTVFAPTNAAFEAISDIVDGLDIETLQTVIAYHLLAGGQNADALLEAGTVSTLAGADLTITAGELGVFIEGIGSTALVIGPNIEACNGIVHVIDTVLLPVEIDPPLPSILDIASDAGFTELIDAVVAASGGEIDFAAAVADCGAEAADLTVFAPTNAAFEAISDVVAGLDVATLQTVIAYHVLGGTQDADALLEAGTATTLAGLDITITAGEAGVFIEGIGSTALVIGPNIDACNGIVHVIDTVLLPVVVGEPDPIEAGNTLLLRNIVHDGFLDADPNGNVDLGSSVELDNLWTLDPVGDGTWRLVNGEFGQFLDADSVSKGYDVNLNGDANGYGVEWEITQQDDGNYALRAIDLNRYLDGDPNGNVDTSSPLGADDIWEIILVEELVDDQAVLAN